jgi:hypothetical protein
MKVAEILKLLNEEGWVLDPPGEVIAGIGIRPSEAR